MIPLKIQSPDLRVQIDLRPSGSNVPSCNAAKGFCGGQSHENVSHGQVNVSVSIGRSLGRRGCRTTDVHPLAKQGLSAAAKQPDRVSGWEGEVNPDTSVVVQVH